MYVGAESQKKPIIKTGLEEYASSDALLHLWGFGRVFFYYFTAKHFLSPFSRKRRFLSEFPQPPRAPPCLTFCAQSLTERKAAGFYILRSERFPTTTTPPQPRTAFSPPSSDYCFVFFPSRAVTPTLYGERQRAFIPRRKPFTSRQLEGLRVGLALFTLG